MKDFELIGEESRDRWGSRSVMAETRTGPRAKPFLSRVMAACRPDYACYYVEEWAVPPPKGKPFLFRVRYQDSYWAAQRGVSLMDYEEKWRISTYEPAQAKTPFPVWTFYFFPDKVGSVWVYEGKRYAGHKLPSWAKGRRYVHPNEAVLDVFSGQERPWIVRGSAALKQNEPGLYWEDETGRVCRAVPSFELMRWKDNPAYLGEEWLIGPQEERQLVYAFYFDLEKLSQNARQGELAIGEREAMANRLLRACLATNRKQALLIFYGRPSEVTGVRAGQKWAFRQGRHGVEPVPDQEIPSWAKARGFVDPGSSVLDPFSGQLRVPLLTTEGVSWVTPRPEWG